MESTLLRLLRPSPSKIDLAKVRQIPVETPLISQEKNHTTFWDTPLLGHIFAS